MATIYYRKHPLYRLIFRLFHDPGEHYRCYRHDRHLRTLTSLHQFHSYVQRLDYQPFLYYQQHSPKKRLEFTAAIQALAIDLRGFRVLDIGPGFGDAMDICHERGAQEVDFIDNDPFFFHFNRLKGYGRGFYTSCVKGLHLLPKNKYDLIWLKGSVNAEHFIRKGILGLLHSCIDGWLRKVERLAAPNCHLIITPLWRNDTKRREVEDLHNNGCTSGLLRNGYRILPTVPNFCGELAYPIAFYKGTGAYKNRLSLPESVAA